MHCTEDILTVRVVPVQQQTNTVDCGLYALAFVKHIADTGSNPSYVVFDGSTMCEWESVNCVSEGRNSFTLLQGKRISVFPLLHL